MKSVFNALKAHIQMSLTANKDKIKSGGSGLNISCLSALKALDATTLSGEQKLHLFTEICRNAPNKAQSIQFKKSLKYLDLLSKLKFFKGKLPEPLQGEFTFLTLQAIALEEGKKALFGDDVLTEEDQSLLQSRYLELAEMQRRPLGLEIYASRIRLLHNPRVNEAMSRFIKSILRDSFKRERYDASLSPHLEKIKTEFPDIWTLWQTLPPPADLLPSAESALPEEGGVSAPARQLAPSPHLESSSYAWLKNTLNTAGHLPEGMTVPAEIASFLGRDEMLESAEVLSQSLNGEISSRSMYVLCLQLCKKGISVTDTLGILKQLQTLVSADDSIKNSQWKRDIDDRIKILSSDQQKGSLVISITDDWQDLFLCGTEVLGSCQSIDGDIDLNKGLLGYCLDGKIQMAVIKDKESGAIRSRALLKLLVPQNGGKPVLFLERIYPSRCPADQEKALNRLGIERARELGIDVYTQNPGLTIDPGSVYLRSLGSPAPYEYEDGGAGVASNGRYVISSSKVIS